MTVRLRLFVAGETPRSFRAVSNLRAICAEYLGEDFELEIIDVLLRPDLADDARILATPTLLKISPAPARRVIGDLSDRRRLIEVLDLQPITASARSHEEGQIQ